jgi:hypothetical protein
MRTAQWWPHCRPGGGGGAGGVCVCVCGRGGGGGGGGKMQERAAPLRAQALTGGVQSADASKQPESPRRLVRHVQHILAHALDQRAEEGDHAAAERVGGLATVREERQAGWPPQPSPLFNKQARQAIGTAFVHLHSGVSGLCRGLNSAESGQNETPSYCFAHFNWGIIVVGALRTRSGTRDSE